MRKITSASNEICDLSLLEGDRSQILLRAVAFSGRAEMLIWGEGYSRFQLSEQNLGRNGNRWFPEKVYLCV